MKASEAHELTDRSIIDNVIPEEYNNIMQNISIAAQQGNYQIVTSICHPQNRQKIQEDGYEIKNCELGYIIKW